MAFSSHGMYILNAIDMLDATQLAFDYSLSTHKLALYLNALTPNFSSDTVYSATNESSGSGYTAGGRTITAGAASGPTLTESPTGTIMYDMGDFSWPTITVTARGVIQYADALASDPLMYGISFGADYTASGGTFLITWPSGGVWTWDVTP